MKLDGIRQQVFLDRYSLKDKKGRSLEKTPEETWRRVARGIASVEKKQARKFWEKKFYQAMEGFKFVPGGRVLAGAGTNFAVTFYNCFVLPSPPDSRDGILDNLKAMIEIMARGGGVGINLSSLRPKGSRVRKVNGFSSGPCNWAELYSLATHDIIQQGGCFTGDTKIMTHLGLVPVGEIINNSRNWYAVTHRGYRKVTGKFDNGVKTVFEVKTKGGYGLRVTGEHRLVTVDASGHFYLKKLADFRIGEQVVLLLGDWLADIPHVQLKTNIPAPSKHSFGRAKITLPKVLDENLAFVIGVYDADGSKVKDKYASNGKGLRIAVAGDRQKDLEKLKEVTKELFGMSPITSKGDGAVYNLSIYSREVNEFLALNELLKQSSVTVAVPVLIFSSPKSVVEAYIAGVFFGDGSNRGGKGGLRITTVSANFASQIQLLLLNLGIAAKIKTQQRPQKNWRTIYTVTINGNRFMEKFAKIVSSYTEKVNDHTISSRDGAFNWPFNLTEKFAYLSGFQRTIARTNPTTSQKAALFLAQRLPMIRDEDYEDVEFLSTCVPDTIASIEKRGEERVYDLEVDDVHLLSGNGFYTSNSRRGALMLMLWDWHPDIEEFITVKQDLRRINGANLSVCVSDKFMEAVKNDSDWDLVFPDMNDKEYDEEWDGILEHWRKLGKKVKRYKTLKARYLWDLICGGAWRSAEPGIVFMERYNKWYNNWYWNTVNCVNPCGEEGLPAWGVCNLGSLNLSAFVKGYSVDKPGEMDYASLAKHAKIAVRFQDDVVDADQYIFPEIEQMQLQGERRIGLGTMGLGDALIKMHLRYGGEESIPVIEKIFKTIRDAAYEASIEIAQEKEPFPKFVASKHLKGYFVKQLPREIRQKMKKYGIRNSVLLQEAPTGTTSLLAGVSSGIEPVYEFEFIRRDRLGEHLMYHPLYEEWKESHANDSPAGKKPDYFVSANDLTPEEHVRVQAAVQKYVDASISKTVNAPKAHTIEDVKKLYTLAYELGCKGITYMREGSREGVLSRLETRQKEEKEAPQTVVSGQIIPVNGIAVIPRPMKLDGATYKMVTPIGPTFVTINHDEEGNPFEVFITIGKSGSDVSAMAEALGRLISLNLRAQATVSPLEKVGQVVEQLSGIGGFRAVGFGQNRVRSLPDAVSKILAMHFGIKTQNGNGTEMAKPAEIKSLQPLPFEEKESLMDICPECGSAALALEEGCRKCYGCGYSEC